MFKNKIFDSATFDIIEEGRVRGLNLPKPRSSDKKNCSSIWRVIFFATHEWVGRWAIDEHLADFGSLRDLT